MVENENKIPKYRKPPVVEVVCGVLFELLEALKAPQSGDFWNLIRSEFPEVDEQPLLSPVVEAFGAVLQKNIQLLHVPPLPRLWFLSERKDRLIQIQRDRFLFNWRRLGADGVYPSYETVFGDFVKYLNVFRDFAEKIPGCRCSPQQYELTYVNHIDGTLIDNTVSKLGRVFRDYAWATDSERWLPLPDDSTWRTSFELPDRAGRLHANVRILTDDETHQRFIRFELTARGIGSDKTFDQMKNWFEIAHEWIVRGFADLTSPEIQREVWGRIDG
jgi:uncharacterized protein (TIGR04255 family)